MLGGIIVWILACGVAYPRMPLFLQDVNHPGEERTVGLVARVADNIKTLRKALDDADFTGTPVREAGKGDVLSFLWSEATSHLQRPISDSKLRLVTCHCFWQYTVLTPSSRVLCTCRPLRTGGQRLAGDVHHARADRPAAARPRAAGACAVPD